MWTSEKRRSMRGKQSLFCRACRSRIRVRRLELLPTAIWSCLPHHHLSNMNRALSQKRMYIGQRDQATERLRTLAPSHPRPPPLFTPLCLPFKSVSSSSVNSVYKAAGFLRYEYLQSQLNVITFPVPLAYTRHPSSTSVCLSASGLHALRPRTSFLSRHLFAFESYLRSCC